MTDLYKEAASLLQRANVKEGSLKTLVYSSSYRNLRQLFALVSECIKYQPILKDVLSRCSGTLLEDEVIDYDSNMAVVLLYELLVGRGFGRDGHLRKAMRKHKGEIKAAKDELLKEKGIRSIKEMLRGSVSGLTSMPRYARVNLIQRSVDEAVTMLEEEGWEFVGKLSNDSFAERVKSLGEFQFGVDPLLEDVFVFPANTDLHKHELVMSGSLILQDRASCVPAHVLNPNPGSVVLDCCAAPGNKTSHLASLMKDEGRVIALDQDAKRMGTMKSLLQRSGYRSVEMVVQDFLTLSATSPEVADITNILVDPSCSGSGMVNQRLSNSDFTINSARLETLKRFQILILKHALRFPGAKRVVYSTCSIHQQENEEVVEEVMSHVHRYFRFVPVLPEWPDSRGLATFKHHQNFLRLSTDKHLTNGFFVACFERLSDVEAKGEGKGSNRVEATGEGEDESAVFESQENGMGSEVKKRKRKGVSEDSGKCLEYGEVEEVKAKKKRKDKSKDYSVVCLEDEEVTEVKKKKKSLVLDDSVERLEEVKEVIEVKEKKKKKKKKKSQDDDVECLEVKEVIEVKEKKKKKKSQDDDVECLEEVKEVIEVKEKKKKKKKSQDDDECLEEVKEVIEIKEKKKKKKKSLDELDDSVVCLEVEEIKEVIEIKDDSFECSENEGVKTKKKRKEKKEK